MRLVTSGRRVLYQRSCFDLDVHVLDLEDGRLNLGRGREVDGGL